MKKLISIIMVLFIQILFVSSTFAETKEEKRIAKIRSEFARLGTGSEAKIEVKLKSGAKVNGHVTEAGTDQFVILDAKTGQPVPVPYPQVKEAKGNNLSTRVIIGIGVVAFVILLVIFAGKS